MFVLPLSVYFFLAFGFQCSSAVAQCPPLLHVLVVHATNCPAGGRRAASKRGAQKLAAQQEPVDMMSMFSKDPEAELLGAGMPILCLAAHVGTCTMLVGILELIVQMFSLLYDACKGNG